MKILQKKTQCFTGYQGLKTPNLHHQIALTLQRTRTMTYSVCISSTRKLAIVDDVVLKRKRLFSLNFFEWIFKIDLKLRAWLSNPCCFQSAKSNEGSQVSAVNGNHKRTSLSTWYLSSKETHCFPTEQKHLSNYSS